MIPRNRISFSNFAIIGLFVSAFTALIWSTDSEAIGLKDFKAIDLKGNYYGGAGVFSSSLEPRVSSSGDSAAFSVTESTDSGFQLFVGRDFSSRFSAEGHFSNLGGATITNGINNGVINYTTYGVSGLLYLIGGGCLLYTSPSPRDGLLSRMPSSA